jgi:hypothetical protein
VPIANTLRLDIATGEQQARDLESAGSQHVVTGGYLQMAAVECAYFQAPYPLAFRLQSDRGHIGMQ